MHVYLFGVLCYFDLTFYKISSQKSVYFFIIFLIVFQEVSQKTKTEIGGCGFWLVLLWTVHVTLRESEVKNCIFFELWTFMLWLCHWIQFYSPLEWLVPAFSYNGRVESRDPYYESLNLCSVGEVIFCWNH